ncbi:MAG TPA: DUF502 domain-containing protein [Chlamydiales bacterium]|nr:DUF502 domain-containing protein [Chlamydiales bacterium]
MKKYFLTGLVIFLPLTLTIAIIVFIVNFLTKPFIGIVSNVLATTQIQHWGMGLFSREQMIRYTSQIIILIGLFILIIAIGYIAKWFLVKTLLKTSDKILHKIPIINKVYKTSQEIINSFFLTNQNSFKQVVLVPFPSIETYSIGLVSRESPQTCKETLNQDLISVFIPTTPNPTSGFLLMFDRKDLIYLDMKTEDAIKYVVSCGVIQPDTTKEKIQ